MIDQSDGDDFLLWSLVTNGWTSVIFAIVAIIFWVVAASNDVECSKKSCPAGMSTKLMEHACMCVTEAR